MGTFTSLMQIINQEHREPCQEGWQQKQLPWEAPSDINQTRELENVDAVPAAKRCWMLSCLLDLPWQIRTSTVLNMSEPCRLLKAKEKGRLLLCLARGEQSPLSLGSWAWGLSLKPRRQH